MAGLRKIKGGKWKVEIRRKGFPSVNKRFHDVKLQESLSERLSLKWREVAKALELIGAVKKAGCPVESVGKAVTIWVLHNQKTIKIILQQNLVKNMYRSTTTVRLDD